MAETMRELSSTVYVIIHAGGRLLLEATSIADARTKADRKQPGIKILAIIQEE